MSVDANSMEEAVAKMKEMMTQTELDAHMSQFHKPEDSKPTLEQSHAMIEQSMVEGEIAGAPAM